MASEFQREGTCGVRSVHWLDGAVHIIDQPALPLEFRTVACAGVEDVFNAIRSMTVRGAPAIGAAGAFGMALAARAAEWSDGESLLEALHAAKARLDAARPTAVNLSWATARICDFAAAALDAGHAASEVPALALVEAQRLADQDVEINRDIGRHGAALIPPNSSVIHHCNTGALATVDIGTALGVIYECHNAGKNIHVWVDETRPRLQGARLTAWELMRAGVPLHLIADSAAGHVLRAGKAQAVLCGADRVTANGDVANKIGTYKLAVCARENDVPVYACVPTSTIDLSMATGDDIEIEERGADEVTTIRGQRIAPEGVPVFNPAFDVTPAKYISAIVTEEGVCYPPFSESLPRAKRAAEERFKEEWQRHLAELKQ